MSVRRIVNLSCTEYRVIKVDFVPTSGMEITSEQFDCRHIS